MSYQVPARKWRPRNFDEVLGQAHVVRALRNALTLNRLHHAYLFTGTRGVGKTTIARILAKCLNCETGVTDKPCGECSACKQIAEGRFVDLLEIDAASRTGVDNMRELLEDANYAPTAGRFKIYLIDEVHMLSLSSFNALLKTLEEPPEHVKFFFATTHPQKLPITILSRCLQFNLTRLLPGEIEEYLAAKLKEESVPFEDAALKQIAIAAEGSVRDGLSLLDQAIAYGNGSLKTEEVETMLGLAARDEVAGLLRCVAGGDAAGLLERIENMYRKAVDFSAALGDLIELLHAIAVQQALPGAETPPQFDGKEVAALAEAVTPEDAQLFYQIALNGKRDLPFLPDARNAFEMTMLRMLSFRFAEAGASAGASAATKAAAGAQAQPAAAPSQPAAAPSQPAAAPSQPAAAQAQPAAAAGKSKMQAKTQAKAPPPPVQPQAQTKTQPQVQAEAQAPATEPPPPPAEASPPTAAPQESPPESPQESSGGNGRDGEAAANGGGARLNLAEFATVEGWPKLIGRLQLAGAQREICLNSVFSVQSAKEVTLALDEHLDQIKTPDREKKIREALSRAAGFEVKVNFTLASPGDETPEQAKQRKQLERQRAAERAVADNAVVKSLQADFGATIVPGSTRPAESADGEAPGGKNPPAGSPAETPGDSGPGE